MHVPLAPHDVSRPLQRAGRSPECAQDQLGTTQRCHPGAVTHGHPSADLGQIGEVPLPDAHRLGDAQHAPLPRQVDPLVADLLGALRGEAQEQLGLPALGPAGHQHTDAVDDEGGGVQGQHAVSDGGEVHQVEQERDRTPPAVADQLRAEPAELRDVDTDRATSWTARGRDQQCRVVVGEGTPAEGAADTGSRQHVDEAQHEVRFPVQPGWLEPELAHDGRQVRRQVADEAHAHQPVQVQVDGVGRLRQGRHALRLGEVRRVRDVIHEGAGPPGGERLRGFTVALVGADGAGKSTVARQVVRDLGRPARYLYMGVNLQTSRVVLPTTWLLLTVKRRRGGRPDLAPHGPVDRQAPRPSGRSRARRATKQALRLTNLVAEEWFRQALVRRSHRRGEVVVCDRHFFADYLAHEIRDRAGRPWPERLHGWQLDRWYPRPDLVVALEAPVEVLLARKGEGTLASLQRRQEEYRLLREEVEHYVSVDAARPLPEVVAAVVEVVSRHAAAR